MRARTVARLLPWLLLPLCPTVLSHCGGATQPEPGTETGNPPVVEQSKIQLVTHPAGVELIADAGALSPGASVRLTNRSTGTSAEGTAEADGSLRLSVPGAVGDEYELTVTNNGGSRSLTLSAVTAPGEGSAGMAGSQGGDTSSIGSGIELSSLSCTQLSETLATHVADAFAAADQSCTRDSDCAYTNWASSGCDPRCGNSILSATGVATARAFVEQDTAGLCSEYESRCEPLPRFPCPSGNPTPECRAGRCQAFDPGTLSCDELANKANAHRDDVITAANRRCTRDADCTLLEASVQCVSGCGNLVAVASSAAGLVPLDLQRVEAIYCSDFLNRPCPGPFPPGCPLVPGQPQASCQAGTCEVILVP